MENSFRFYRNLDCAYFPCHKVENEEEFNCLFCYCPLYFLKECGGKHEDKYGIKDCSNCLIPHRPNGYDYINNKIREYNEEQIDKKFNR
jgi:Zn-finger protein